MPTRSGTSKSRPTASHTPRCGHRHASRNGEQPVNGERSPSGPRLISPRSSTRSPPTGSSPCGGSSPCAAYVAARHAACVGPTSTSTTACCSSSAAAPSSATRSSKENPKRLPARAPSLSTNTPWPCSASTNAASVSNRSPARRQAEPVTTAATCSSAPTHPGYATRHFSRLVKRADIPPIRLHDLRHGAASLAHEAGADLKTGQDQLGHASIVTTADTYTSVLPYAQRRSAEATARLVLAAARRTREKIRKTGQRSRPAPRPKNKRTTRQAPVTSPRKSRSTHMRPKHDYGK